MSAVSPQLQDKLDNLSKKPGVYLFKDRNGDIIYIGKAKVLRNRVRSYFQDSRRFESKTLHLVSRIYDLETIITDTEVEALILEANLVKEHRPRYNINLKDDKSFPFIRVTNETYPRIFPTRKIVHDGSQYFGPYTDVLGMKALLSTIKKIFPIRSCNLPLNDQTITEGKFKVCLNYHIQRCYGPCEGLVSEAEYNETINNIIEFIKGNTRSVEKRIKERMQSLAADLKFEQAARLRDQLKSVELFAERQKVLDSSFSDRDVIATAVDEQVACSVLFRVRQGKLISKDHFYLENVQDENIVEINKAFVQQFYLRLQDIPWEVVVPVHFEDEHAALQQWLSQQAKTKVKLTAPQRGEKARMVKMCERNAKHHLEELLLKRQAAKEYIAGSVKALQQALNLPTAPRRIEGFDISNIQGTHPVASMVCFVNGRPLKSEYRHFKIQSKHTPDDFAMMHEAVKRRYTRVLRENKPLADLILIDGGKGQLSAAQNALKEVGLEQQPIIALAKRLDEVFIPGQSEAQNIPRDSSGLKLLQRVRDESHRFAITFHRKLRKKQSLTSELDVVPGIGLKRKQMLLKAFGSLHNLKSASVQELKQINGISEKLAQHIYDHIHPEPQR